MDQQTPQNETHRQTKEGCQSHYEGVFTRSTHPETDDEIIKRLMQGININDIYRIFNPDKFYVLWSIYFDYERTKSKITWPQFFSNRGYKKSYFM